MSRTHQDLIVRTKHAPGMYAHEWVVSDVLHSGANDETREEVREAFSEAFHLSGAEVESVRFSDERIEPQIAPLANRPSKRPPLGVIPEVIWLEQRVDALREAINQHIGEEWCYTAIAAWAHEAATHRERIKELQTKNQL